MALGCVGNLAIYRQDDGYMKSLSIAREYSSQTIEELKTARPKRTSVLKVGINIFLMDLLELVDIIF
jgi:hypothetical protein